MNYTNLRVLDTPNVEKVGDKFLDDAKLLVTINVSTKVKFQLQKEKMTSLLQKLKGVLRDGYWQIRDKFKQGRRR